MIVAELLAWSADYLIESGFPPIDARAESRLLVRHCLGYDTTQLITRQDSVPHERQVAHIKQVLQRRSTGEPIAYIIGQKEFWGLNLRITRDVLIPRHETELLVEVSLRLCAELERLGCQAHRALDLGSGSGALALALASERPRWEIYGYDNSPQAVALSRSNARQLHLDNVNFALADWMQWGTGTSAPENQKYPLICSNPPYIHPDDPHLDLRDLRFEPRSALVSEPDGLGALRRIIADVPENLLIGGYLAVEHGYTQAADVRALFQQAGFTGITTERDLAQLSRVTFGVWAGY